MNEDGERARASARVVVEAADAGERADVVLGRRVPGLSRRAARAMALDGRLAVDGRRARPSLRLRAGQVVELSWQRDPAPGLRTLLATGRYVYVDKPAGLHTHGLRPDGRATLAEAVIAVHPECATASPSAREGGAIHRLDAATSGIVAFARTHAAWELGRRAVGSDRAIKGYVAVVDEASLAPAARDELGPSAWIAPAPTPPALDDLVIALGLVPAAFGPTWRISAPIGAAPGRGRSRVRPDGLPAVTRLRVGPAVRTGGRAGRLVAIALETGRRHQIRVHLAFSGLGILGDAHYLGDADGPLRLHAARLDLGMEGEPPVFAEPPADWALEIAAP